MASGNGLDLTRKGSNVETPIFVCRAQSLLHLATEIRLIFQESFCFPSTRATSGGSAANVKSRRFPPPANQLAARALVPLAE